MINLTTQSLQPCWWLWEAVLKLPVYSIIIACQMVEWLQNLLLPQLSHVKIGWAASDYFCYVPKLSNPSFTPVFWSICPSVQRSERCIVWAFFPMILYTTFVLCLQPSEMNAFQISASENVSPYLNHYHISLCFIMAGFSPRLWVWPF